MKYEVNKMVLCTICQKCPAKPTKTPLTEFLLPNGLLWVPEMLYCPDCGLQLTINTKSMTKEELEEQKKKEERIDKRLVDPDEPAIVYGNPDEFASPPLNDDVVADAAEKYEDAGKPDAETQTEN